MADESPQLLKQAADLVSSGSLKQARDMCVKVCELNPEDPETWLKLGHIQCRLKCFDDAVLAFRQCVALVPDKPAAHLFLGQVFHIQGKLGESLSSLQEAVRLQPDLAEANYFLGVTHIDRGDQDKGLECLGEVWRIAPDFADIWYRYGSALAMQGSYADAIPVYEQGLAISPQGMKPFIHEVARKNADAVNRVDNDDPITIATSIVPSGRENQRKAIDSWKQQGFNVISINSKAEIDQLRTDFGDVEFCKAERSALETYGKPYVYFDDVLRFLSETDSRVCGIVNSDIHLLDDRLASYAKQEATDSFLFGCRVDIPSLDRPSGQLYRFGYDYYFFDRQYLSMYPQDEFCIGLPWWDYWAALVPVLRDVPARKLTTPVAFHVAHDMNWQQDSWVKYARRVASYIDPESMPTADTTNDYSNYVWLLIENHCSPVSIPEQ